MDNEILKTTAENDTLSACQLKRTNQDSFICAKGRKFKNFPFFCQEMPF